jgi:lipoprotein-anchoring transpeptidase ErfK/SrfK
MRNQRFFLVALGIAASICALVTTLPVHALSSSAPSTTTCDPYDTYNGDPECRPTLKQVQPTPTRAPTPVPALMAPSIGVLPFTYAYVMTGPVAFYGNPADLENGIPPVRTLDAGYLWVRIAGMIAHDGQTWYLTDGGGFLPASIAALARPSAFHGIAIQSQLATPFAWVLKSVKTSADPGSKPDTNSASFKRYDMVNIYEQREKDGQTWYRVGDNQWLVQTAVAKIEKTPPPAGVGPGEKWIDVNLFEQTMVAYEGDRMVYATLASTGLPRWPTVKGLFRIQVKVTLGPMSGQEGKPDYYSLEDVPWAMYFYEGYSLHGTYWHDGFGYRHSHGCVNLSPIDAKWLYNWTTPVVAQGGRGAVAPKDNPGTWVSVHD